MASLRVFKPWLVWDSKLWEKRLNCLIWSQNNNYTNLVYFNSKKKVLASWWVLSWIFYWHLILQQHAQKTINIIMRPKIAVNTIREVTQPLKLHPKLSSSQEYMAHFLHPHLPIGVPFPPNHPLCKRVWKTDYYFSSK